MQTKTKKRIPSIFLKTERLFNDLGEDYIIEYFLIKENFHNIIKALIFKQIYIKEEKMGVRIENNLWITKTGNQDLFKNIPIKADEIEALMKKTKK